MRMAALLFLVLAGQTLTAQAEPFGLDALMRMLASSTHGSASFSEKKFISLLDAPVDSSGELRFVPPSRLEKHTLKPRREILVLDGNVLSIEQGRQKHVLQLSKYPEIAGMIESIRATLAGDRVALERVYRVNLNGGAGNWIMQLTPLDERVAKVVTRIRLEGVRDNVRRMEVLLADGDRSVMNIKPGITP